MHKIITLLMLLACMSVKSQAKEDSTIKKDTAVKLYYLVMPEQNWRALLSLIKTVDEKPSVLKQWTDMIIGNLTEVRGPSVSNAPAKKKN